MHLRNSNMKRREQSEFEELNLRADEEDDSEGDDTEDRNWVYPLDYVTIDTVDHRDEGTPDNWVKRHPDLVRLTGRHPFNSEPPLARLMEYGFLTPTSIHYVRNHGYVPQAVFEEWTVEVCGLVKRPQIFKMKQIMEQFEPCELPVTLVCAGNRRKEQNMVKQTIGFNWGPAATGTSIWRGARLCDVLRETGVYSKRKAEMSVCIEGGEMLPGGGGSRYGTSISLHVALDHTQDVLLAYMQNGQLLEPDHGFPVRMIIPGYIGGRMVKWVTRIEVTNKESENYYHYHDNRVLPSHVDAEVANAEGWWQRPGFVINELNINSVITTPAHSEVLTINGCTLQVPFSVKGYAYSGGGRKVIRVEVTIDRGESWKLCKISYPQKPTKYGKHWCWCFWEIQMEVSELVQAKELAVRAWDTTMNTQPQTLTWNVMGMMNNCWYVVKMTPCTLQEGGSIGLVFEHPIQPGNQMGGWMLPKERESTQLHTKQFFSKKPAIIRQITMAEVKQHDSPNSPWIIVHDNVYDCTNFLKEHPGGLESIVINAGTDCTEEFDVIHSDKAQELLEDFKIGQLLPAQDGDSISASMPEILTAKHIALDPRHKIKCKLSGKKRLSHNVRLLRFDLPREDQVLGVPVGKHILLSARVQVANLCMRAYTPVTCDEEESMGYFEILVKIYITGVMSQHLEEMRIGEEVEVKGPLGRIEYEGKGQFLVEGKGRFMKRCAMLAGGTGITAMYRFIRAIVRDAEDNTEVYLVYANRTAEDIMLRRELDTWVRESSKLKVWYVLSQEREEMNGTYSLGHICEHIIKHHLPHGSSPCTFAFLCGPPPMVEYACLPNLLKHGYLPNQCYQF